MGQRNVRKKMTKPSCDSLNSVELKKQMSYGPMECWAGFSFEKPEGNLCPAEVKVMIGLSIRHQRPTAEEKAMKQFPKMICSVNT